MHPMEWATRGRVMSIENISRNTLLNTEIPETLLNLPKTLPAPETTGYQFLTKCVSRRTLIPGSDNFFCRLTFKILQMSGQEKVRVAAAIVAYLIIKKKKRKRKCWVRDWIARREEECVHVKLLKQLRCADETLYTNFVRISPADFDYVLGKIFNRIKRKDTHLRKSIQPVERIILTLRFLATGDSYHSLMYLFRIPVTTISKIIPEVCTVIYEELKQ